jgi:hypothetical protein
VRENAGVWLGEGRWTVFLIESLLFPQPAIPYAPFIVLIVCLAISYSLITRVHNYPANWKTYASYPLFCAFPTWWFISEFYSNVPAVGIGVLLVSISIFLTYRNSRADCINSPLKTGSRLAIVMLLACAIGAYQSLILLYLVMAAGVALIKLLRSNGKACVLVEQAIRKIVQIIVLTAASILLYVAINYAAQKISGEHSAYIGNFIKIDILLKAPRWLAFTVVTDAWHVYSGAISVFGASMPLASVLLVLSTVTIAFGGNSRAAVCLFLWLFVLTAPFALQFLSGVHAVPLRSMLSLAYVTWLMGMILLSHTRIAVALIGTIVVGIYQLQIISVTSQYIALANITQAHDRMLAADIYRRIGELSYDFDRDSPIEIDVYGHKKINTVYAKGRSSMIGDSFFDWNRGNLLRMVTYMKVMGYQSIKMGEEDARRAMTPLFEDMSVWPAAGSVKKVGERYLVRLSLDPDPVHAGYKN